jgi:hypothetical protein
LTRPAHVALLISESGLHLMSTRCFLMSRMQQ